MTITLKPRTEALLRVKTQQNGQDLDSFVNALVVDALTTEEQEHRETALAVQQAMEAAHTGREKTLNQYLAEQRQKHGYPDAWPSQGSVKKIAPGVFVDRE